MLNPQMSLESIAKEVFDRIQESSRGSAEVAEALREITSRALPDGKGLENDFEVLVGSFEEINSYFSALRVLAEHLGEARDDAAEALTRIERFSEEIRNMATSHVLEIIAERSKAFVSADNHLANFCDLLLKSAKGRVTVATLNYDTYLMSSLLSVAKSEMQDLASGKPDDRIEIDARGKRMQARKLRRTISEFDARRRVTFLPLHGSLLYWGDPDQDFFVKVDKSDLDVIDQWSEIRSGNAKALPLVVLTSSRHKSAKASGYPFRLAFEKFWADLTTSEHWLVAGYAFRDKNVNDALRSALAARESAPRILIVTKGEDPPSSTISEVFGRDVDNSLDDLTVYREGLETLAGSPEWQSFIS